MSIISLANYGITIYDRAGFLEKAFMWPMSIQHKIATTYRYFGGSIGVAAAGAYTASLITSLVKIKSRTAFQVKNLVLEPITKTFYIV